MNYGKAYKQELLNFEGEPVNEEEIKQFALALLYADTEDDVISILKSAGYWDNRNAWRLYGDKEGNWSHYILMQKFETLQGGTWAMALLVNASVLRTLSPFRLMLIV